MKLYVRHREGIWITFLHDVKEFKEFIDTYIPGRTFVLGDIATYSSTMKNMLLKFVEENPSVDVYSSTDIVDPILLSRFVEIIKAPISISPMNDVDGFLQSDRSYLSASLYLSNLSNADKLRATKCNVNNLKLLTLNER